MGLESPPGRRVPLVKLVVALLGSSAEPTAEALSLLQQSHGPADFVGTIRAFPSDYYEAEMGPGLVKQLVSFSRPIDRLALPALKERAMELERRLARPDGSRRVNIDPGYMTDAQFVLATTKNRPHRLQLSPAVFGEVTLLWRRGQGWRPAGEWTYPDYLQAAALDELGRMRVLLMRDWALDGGGEEPPPAGGMSVDRAGP